MKTSKLIKAGLALSLSVFASSAYAAPCPSPVVDAKGNISFTFGDNGQHVVALTGADYTLSLSTKSLISGETESRVASTPGEEIQGLVASFDGQQFVTRRNIAAVTSTAGSSLSYAIAYDGDGDNTRAFFLYNDGSSENCAPYESAPPSFTVTPEYITIIDPSLVDLGMAFNNQSAELDQCRQSLSDTQRDLQNCTNDLNNANNQLNQCNADLQACIMAGAEKDQEIARLNDLINQLRIELAQKEKDMAALQSQIASAPTYTEATVKKAMNNTKRMYFWSLTTSGKKRARKARRTVLQLLRSGLYQKQ